MMGAPTIMKGRRRPQRVQTRSLSDPTTRGMARAKAPSPPMATPMRVAESV